MKKIYCLFTFLCMIMVLFSCKTQKITVTTYSGYNPKAAYILKRDTFTLVQVDSMSNSDNLPNINKWTSAIMKDAETNIAYTYYTLFDKNSNIIYTVKMVNNKYIVIKKQINQ